jgi:hypothetical protein
MKVVRMWDWLFVKQYIEVAELHAVGRGGAMTTVWDFVWFVVGLEGNGFYETARCAT